jgi:hypothetical protein
MNWTEGSLARYARGRNGKETVLKQKKHFAKARSAASSKTETARRAFNSNVIGDCALGSNSAGQSTSSVRVKDRTMSRFWTREINQENARLSTSPQRVMAEKGAEKTLAEKRLKLLAKSDWVGLSVQKPVEIDFAADEPTTRNGKWSKVKSRDVNARTRNSGIDERFAAVRSGTFAQQLGRVDREQVKVTIGSEYMRLGDDSTVWRHAGDDSSSVGCSHSRCSLGEKHSSTRERSPSHPQLPWLLLNVTGLSNTRSSIGRTPRSGCEERRTRSTSIEIPPSILQPKPRRQILADILSHQSTQSDGTASNIAQLGLSMKCVSPTKELQNQQWKANLDIEGTSQVDGEASSLHARVQISPGMSEWAPPNTHAEEVPSISQAVEHRSPPRDISFGQPHALATNDRFGNDAGLKLAEMRNSSPLLGGDNAGLIQPTAQITDSCNIDTDGLASAEVDMPVRVEPAEDPNDAWRHFVFADDEEDLTEEVLHEAAGEIYDKQLPRLTGLFQGQGSACDPVDERVTDARTDLATVSSDNSRDVLLPFEPQDQKESSCTLAKLPSSSATVGALYSRSGQLHGGATVSPSFGSQAGRTERASPEGWSDSTSLLVLHTISEAAKSPREESFRFAPPKLFVGKNSGPAGTSILTHGPEPPAPRRRDLRRRRRMGRRASGRPDIAKLPDYFGDPIEEFSDEAFRHQPKPSLFGALEME